MQPPTMNYSPGAQPANPMQRDWNFTTSSEEVRSLLDAAAKLDCSDSDAESTKLFRIRYADCLCRPEIGILHQLAKRTDWPAKKVKWFLQRGLGDGYRAHLIFKHQQSRDSPIHTAIKEQNGSFLRAVLRMTEHQTLGEIIETDTRDFPTAIHQAITYRSPFTNWLLGAYSFTRALKKRDQEGNTPLHLAVSFLDKESSVENAKERYPCNLQLRTVASFSSYDTVRYLIRLFPSALQCLNQNKHTPYQLRLHLLAENPSTSGATNSLDEISDIRHINTNIRLRKIIQTDAVASYILSYCIRQYPREEVLGALYIPKEELHIELDLSGMQSKSLPLDYLQDLSRHISFEYVLRYVSLPDLRFSSKEDERSTVKTRYRKDYLAVFNWLREKGVRKIIEVIVIDDKVPCHPGEIIINTLIGFEVEIWNWKQWDIPSHVVWNSTSVVRDLFLYLSKHETLSDWFDTEILWDKIRFPQLMLVSVLIRQGQNAATLADEVRKASIANNNRANGRILSVTVAVEGAQDDTEETLVPSSIKPTRRDDPWIASARDFAICIQKISTVEVPGLRVALLDDGVDPTQPGITGIVHGSSFSDHFNVPFYVSATGHGTAMARIICEIYPMCRLYVANIHGARNDSGDKGSISLSGAAKAITWAVTCEVDIICMAWSVTKHSAELEEAVYRARSENIVMFHATSDEGSNASQRNFPSQYSECISIAGVDHYGNPKPWTTTDRADYGFPAEINAANQSQRYVGSSVATALASGLAGLLLHCQRQFSKPSEDEAQFRRDVKLRWMFDRLALKGGREDQKCKYINTERVFGPILRKRDEPQQFKGEVLSFIRSISDHGTEFGDLL
ncbi:peptidase S8/S53 domain-containing protein [Xylariaceae sp. FL1651]|nr:peptidase S8/S53 domain-containing protein [Xylariaceae sp. FL1651]